eukprot:gene31444-6624_t
MASGQTDFSDLGMPLYYHIPQCAGLKAAIKLIDVNLSRPRKGSERTSDLQKAFTAWPFDKTIQDIPDLPVHYEEHPDYHQLHASGSFSPVFDTSSESYPTMPQDLLQSPSLVTATAPVTAAFSQGQIAQLVDANNFPASIHYNNTNLLSPSSDPVRPAFGFQAGNTNQLSPSSDPVRPAFGFQAGNTNQLSPSSDPVRPALGFQAGNTNQLSPSSDPVRPALGFQAGNTNQLSPSSVPVRPALGFQAGNTNQVSPSSVPNPSPTATPRTFSTNSPQTPNSPNSPNSLGCSQQRHQSQQQFHTDNSITATPDRNMQPGPLYDPKEQGGGVQMHSTFAGDNNLRQPWSSGGVEGPYGNSEDLNHLWRAGPPTHVSEQHPHYPSSNASFPTLQQQQQLEQQQWLPTPVSEQHPHYPSSNVSFPTLQLPQQQGPPSSSLNAAAATMGTFAGDHNLRQPPSSGGGVGSKHGSSVVNTSGDPKHLGSAGPPMLVSEQPSHYFSSNASLPTVQQQQQLQQQQWLPTPVSEQHPHYPSSNASLPSVLERTEPLSPSLHVAAVVLPSSSLIAAAATVESGTLVLPTASMAVQGQHLWHQQQNNRQTMAQADQQTMTQTNQEPADDGTDKPATSSRWLKRPKAIYYLLGQNVQYFQSVYIDGKIKC